MRFLNADELEAGLPEILASPKDDGVVSMIVRRPDTDRALHRSRSVSLWNTGLAIRSVWPVSAGRRGARQIDFAARRPDSCALCAMSLARAASRRTGRDGRSGSG